MGLDLPSASGLADAPDGFPIHCGAQRVGSRKSTYSFISSLPDELLCEIFYFLDHRDRIRCTHVCWRWRGASLAAPGLLWSDVQSRQCMPGVFTELLDRTRTVPASVTVTITENNIADVSSSLARHLHHCRSIFLHIKEQLTAANEALLGSALVLDAPLVEKFIVMDIFGSISSGLPDPSNLFGRRAPKLTCVKLYGSALPYSGVPAFADVQQLLYEPFKGPFDFSHYTACLQLCPAVKDLSLELRELSAQGIWQLPSSLRSLSIIPVGNFDPTSFLGCVSHDSVPRINVRFLSEPPAGMTEHVMQHLVANVRVVTMFVDGWEYERLAVIELISEQGRALNLYNVNLSICPSIATSLTDLRITEVQWVYISNWPPLPALEDITVYLVTVVNMITTRDYDSIFFSPPAHSSLVCPQLCILTFSARRRGDTALLGYDSAVGCDTVISFVTHHIRCGKPKIPRLALNGLHLHPSVATTIISLLELFEDIDYGPGHEKPQYDPSEELLCWT